MYVLVNGSDSLCGKVNKLLQFIVWHKGPIVLRVFFSSFHTNGLKVSGLVWLDWLYGIGCCSVFGDPYQKGQNWTLFLFRLFVILLEGGISSNVIAIDCYYYRRCLYFAAKKNRGQATLIAVAHLMGGQFICNYRFL